MRPGSRLRIIRYLLGLRLSDMSELLNIKESRYHNIENCSAKMNEEDFIQIARFLPEILKFILISEPLSVTELAKSKSLLSTIPLRIDNGLVPENFENNMVTE